jgi:hypothetical protein
MRVAGDSGPSFIGAAAIHRGSRPRGESESPALPARTAVLEGYRRRRRRSDSAARQSGSAAVSAR